MGILSGIKLYVFKKRWRKMNPDNETYPANIFNQELVKVGRKTYGELYVSAFNDRYKISIGHFCSIAPNVIFLLSADHSLNYLSTFPFKTKCLKEGSEGISKGDIIIDSDVWIGQNAIILSGVHVAQGAVIAAGAVVTKNVPAYAVVGGNPARIIKYRFNEDIIERLIKIKFENLTDEFIERHKKILYSELNDISDLYLILDEQLHFTI